MHVKIHKTVYQKKEMLIMVYNFFLNDKYIKHIALCPAYKRNKKPRGNSNSLYSLLNGLGWGGGDEQTGTLGHQAVHISAFLSTLPNEVLLFLYCATPVTSILPKLLPQ